jgi:hypothetical protein
MPVVAAALPRPNKTAIEDRKTVHFMPTSKSRSPIVTKFTSLIEEK